MGIFNFGNYDSTVHTEDEVFSTAKQYTNPSSEQETRRQLSTPLYELKAFINGLFDSNGKIIPSNIPTATTSTAGLMSSTDKAKLNQVWDVVYPVGSLYLSVSSTDPSTFFTGTTWEQITTDAYLKIVTSNGGEAGGTSSQHKIPIESMPTHNHGMMFENIFFRTGGGTGVIDSVGYNSQLETPMATLNAGAGQAYYPYYVGVYVWKRTA